MARIDAATAVDVGARAKADAELNTEPLVATETLLEHEELELEEGERSR
jgi:hypothetical protein